jgi:hypothetical protein
MATLGDSTQIIVGAAQLFVSKSGSLKYIEGSSPAEYSFDGAAGDDIPNFVAGTEYANTLAGAGASANWRNVGYTMNGLEVQFQPDFGEVQVDQLLDVARLYKQGMQVNMVTAFAEGTLENLVVAVAANDADYDDSNLDEITLNMASGNLGEVPLERALIAIGPGSGDPAATGANKVERVYVAHRALSIESVTASAKRDEATMFEVSFRLLPANNGSYGKIVDRVVGP